MWIVLLALILGGGGLMYAYTMRTYVPLYRCEAMFSVSVSYSGSTDLAGYSYYYDKSAAQLVASTFPYLLESEVMNELIRQELGTPVIPAAISVTSVAETNLLTLTVTGADPQSTYDTITAVMNVYPQVSRQVIGETQLVITRAPLMPLSPFNAPPWQRNVVLGAALGFILGMGLLVLMALSRRTVLSGNDLKAYVSLPCLSRVPNVHLKQRKKSTTNTLLITTQQSDSPFNEAFRLLRLKLDRLLQPSDKVLLYSTVSH